MTPDVFPNMSEFVHAAVQQTATRQGCTESMVYAALEGLDGVWNERKGHVKRVREATHAFNRAADLAEELSAALRDMTEGQRNNLTNAGCITVFQIEHLRDKMKSEAEGLAEWIDAHPTTGGRNPAAYDVAEMVRRIFRRQRRPVTYGLQADSGSPSTPFGRAVRDALGDFGIEASWRGPTQKACDEDLKRQSRLLSMHLARQQRT